MKIRRIAIVGGGTAGWLAANHLGVEFSRRPDIDITLIESKDVPVIGVGEGTVPRIKATLQKFGISELELVAECDVTFKQGVKFAGWMGPKKTGSNYYYHPFSPPYPGGYDLTNYWLNNSEAFEYSQLSDFYSLAQENKSPKRVSSSPYEGVVDYAYHFDAAKFSSLLAKNAREKFSVKHTYRTISRVERSDNGSVKSLVYTNGEEQEFDFYIDCSGFSSLLIGEALNVPFVDKSYQVKTDSVLVYRKPTEASEEILPYTLATAHEAGWVWDIPLTTRRGLGFVYSADFMSENRAVEAFSEYLGYDVERGDLRSVPMKIGYRDLFWEKNCVALGLAQGFVEPLEATSILVTDFAASLIARNFPDDTQDIQALADHCNPLVRYTWERVIDFVQLHYCLSDRRDSDFWCENTESPKLSEVLEGRLGLWQLQPPQKSDFFSRFDIFGPENYLYILYGMRFSTKSKPMGPAEAEKYREIIAKVEGNSRQLSAAMLSHRKWLSELKKALNKG